jgi:predicted N-formylglutamate amidohydrolase
MKKSPETQTVRAVYSSDLAAGQKLRAEAVHAFTAFMMDLPRQVMCRIAQRMDRRTGTPGHVTDCA